MYWTHVMQAATNLTIDTIQTIIKDAQQKGLSGFGGKCGVAAIAINHVLFQDKGTIVAGINTALESCNICIGHVAVRIETSLGDIYWDMDAEPKDEDRILSWGSLDPEDTDYRELAEEQGLSWSEEHALEAQMMEYDEIDDVLNDFGGSPEDVEAAISILKTAYATYSEVVIHINQDPQTIST